MKLKKSWSEINVGQFIELQQLASNKEINADDRAEIAVGIAYGMTRQQVESLKLNEFNELARSCKDIMTSTIEGKPKKIIKGSKNKYEIEYNPKNLTQRQFVEVQYFSKNMLENIHLILASIVKRVGKFGKRYKNVAEDHEQISNDLLGVPVSDVYNSCVFFCTLYLNSLTHLRGYLIQEMMQKGATIEQATTLLNHSIETMAGSITQKKWLISKI